jgi:hypothetical protein
MWRIANFSKCGREILRDMPLGRRAVPFPILDANAALTSSVSTNSGHVYLSNTVRLRSGNANFLVRCDGVGNDRSLSSLHKGFLDGGAPWVNGICLYCNAT